MKRELKERISDEYEASPNVIARAIPMKRELKDLGVSPVMSIIDKDRKGYPDEKGTESPGRP